MTTIRPRGCYRHCSFSSSLFVCPPVLSVSKTYVRYLSVPVNLSLWGAFRRRYGFHLAHRVSQHRRGEYAGFREVLRAKCRVEQRAKLFSTGRKSNPSTVWRLLQAKDSACDVNMLSLPPGGTLAPVTLWITWVKALKTTGTRRCLSCRRMHFLEDIIRHTYHIA